MEYIQELITLLKRITIIGNNNFDEDLAEALAYFNIIHNTDCDVQYYDLGNRRHFAIAYIDENKRVNSSWMFKKLN